MTNNAFRAMSISERNHIRKWAQEHDWGYYAHFDGYRLRGIYEAGDHNGTEYMFDRLSDLRQWAGY